MIRYNKGVFEIEDAAAQTDIYSTFRWIWGTLCKKKCGFALYKWDAAYRLY